MCVSCSDDLENSLRSSNKKNMKLVLLLFMQGMHLIAFDSPKGEYESYDSYSIKANINQLIMCNEKPFKL